MTRSGLLRLAPWLNGLRERSVEGRNLYLRPPRMEDYESWRDLRLASRSFLEPWEPSWDDQEYTRAAFRARARRYEDLARDDLAHAYFIFSKANDEFLGAITMSNIRRGIAQTGTLGYWIGAVHAGKGHMTDALSHMVSHAFTQFGLHRVEAACLPRNEVSARLLARCGFQHEGYAKSYLRINGVWEDHLLFGRIAGS